MSARAAAGAIVMPGAHDFATGTLTPAPSGAQEWLAPARLLGLDDATRLALLAVHAMGQGRALPAPGPGTGVVVSSNFSNLDTVVLDLMTVRDEGERALSAMRLANHSANAISAAVAIHHGWQGPNVTVACGERSGSRALAIAQLMMGSGRFDHVVVIGVEPANQWTAGLMDFPSAFATTGLAVALHLHATAGGPGVDDTAESDAWLVPALHGARGMIGVAARVCLLPGGVRTP